GWGREARAVCPDSNAPRNKGDGKLTVQEAPPRRDHGGGRMAAAAAASAAAAAAAVAVFAVDGLQGFVAGVLDGDLQALDRDLGGIEGDGGLFIGQGNRDF